MMETVLDLDNAVTNYSVDWADVTAEQAQCLQILRDERNKRQSELQKRNQR